MAKPKSFRRRLFVDRFQYRIALLHLAHFAGFAAVIFAAFYLPLLVKLDDTSLSPMQKMELSSQFQAQTERWMPVLWLVFGLLLVSSAIVSHRLAGPLARMRGALKAAAEGDLRRGLSIRRRDYLVREAEIINALIVSLNTKMGEIKQTQRRAEACLQRLNGTLRGAPQDTREELEALRTEIDALKVTLSAFKTAEEAADSKESPRAPVPSLTV